jgi:heme oxygenase (biliverdin-IX-beta and delta-forming)
MSEYSPHRVPRTEASASIAEAHSVHARLRQATADPHQRLDRGLRYILSESLAEDRYADLLGALFGFYVPLEDYLSEREAAWTPLVLPLIRRAGLLERDLRAFGRAPEQVPRCPEMPTLTTVDHLAGAIYVVEGACLGGQVIARAVMQRFRITRENGAAFFNGDGAQTGARWKLVLAWLEQRSRGTGVGDDIAAGACRTFAALSHWLMAREVLDE